MMDVGFPNKVRANGDSFAPPPRALFLRSVQRFHLNTAAGTSCKSKRVKVVSPAETSCNMNLHKVRAPCSFPKVLINSSYSWPAVCSLFKSIYNHVAVSSSLNWSRLGSSFFLHTIGLERGHDQYCLRHLRSIGECHHHLARPQDLEDVARASPAPPCANKYACTLLRDVAVTSTC